MLFNSLETLIVPGILPLVYIVYFGKHWLNPTLCSYFTGENSRAPKGEITCPPSHRAHGFSQTRNPTTVPSKALFNFCWRRGSLALGRWGWGVVENLYRWRTWMVESQACGRYQPGQVQRKEASSCFQPPCFSSLGAQPESLPAVLRAGRTPANKNAAFWAQKPG